MDEQPKRRGRPPKVREEAPVASVSAISTHERAAIAREAWEAYDMQDDRVRFDSLGRKWDLRMDNLDGHWKLRLLLVRGMTAKAAEVPQAALGTETGYQHVERAVADLDEAVQ